MKVNSSMISEISDWKEGQFDIKFVSGQTYRYFDVPKGIYEKLLTANSIGKFFDLFIKKAGYKYQELTFLITNKIDWKKRAGDLHDRIHEVAALVNTNGVEIGWAPEEAIPILEEALEEAYNEGKTST